ncbi:SAC3/GANP/Nin1/mts3/eIF-3 p25 family-domain-containing protein [Obelidium mucronatum]|nr:SAC3/GANP/Nin1/mts3/eIF-3 p25 family-domain-containing protein [Obelidium mucronatum]
MSYPTPASASWFPAGANVRTAISTAAIPPGAPTDINSPEYAVWYQWYMSQYLQQQQMAMPAAQQQQLQQLQPQPQQSEQPQSKLQMAMAELAMKSKAGATLSPQKTQQNQEMLAKASQFKPHSKKPAYIPVKTGLSDAAAAAANLIKPSYASVTAASTSSTTAAPAGPNPLTKLKLKNFVDRVFNAAGPARKPEAERYLGPLIQSIQSKGAMDTTDWDKMSIPAFLLTDPGTESSSPATTTASKKRKKFSLDLLEDRGNVPISPTNTTLLKSKHPKLTPADNPPSISTASSPALDSLPQYLRTEEIARREERARRFQDVDGAASKQKQRDNAKAARERALQAAAFARGEENPDVIDWDEYTIIGVCERLEKSYLRLTSAPDPATVRPLHILRQTLDLLGRKWKQDQNYTYICDQFKSLRQDLTVQRIKNDFTVKVYESHARIALEKGDVGEYNQCQAQLKELYRHGLQGCKDEFLGYRILYMVYTMNRTEQVRILSELTPTETSAPSVQHALGVRMAVSTGDYHTLFKLYNASPCMSIYLMDLFIERERIKALKTISRAFRPSLKVSYLAKELGFIVGGENATLMDEGVDSKNVKVGVEDCFSWLKGMGTPFVEGPEEDVEVLIGKGKKAKTVVKKVRKEVGVMEAAVDLKAAAVFFVGKMNEVLGKGVDIKGQIH